MAYDSAPVPVLSMPLPEKEQVVDRLCCQSRALEATPKARVGRPSTLSWGHLCLGVVACVLMGWQSQLDLRRVLCLEGFWHWPAIGLLCDQAISNRLDRAASRMKESFEQMSHGLRERLLPYQDREVAPFASGVYALDESTLDEMGRWLPELRELCQKDPRLRAGRSSALLDVRVQQWWKVAILQEAKANGKVHARSMIEALPAGTLLLFDRGYFACEWFDELTARGLFWISRYSNHASYQIVPECYRGDGILDAIITLGTYRSDRARSPVRLLQLWYRGQQYSYLTNVCDPLVLSLAEVVRLYARRWDIELGFRLLKDHLQLRLLWSAKWSLIQVQLWAGLLLAQVFHGLQQEIAHQAGVKPEEVSLEVLVRLTPRWLQQGMDPVRYTLRWGRELGIIRPSSRTSWQVPLIEPSWITPPPANVLHPRQQARHAHRKCQARSPSQTTPSVVLTDGPRVKLKGGVLVSVRSNLLE